MMIDSIRNYFLDCPLIDQYSKINVDYLGVESVEYTIDPVPTEPILKRYVDGGTLRQYLFVFGSREYYGADTLQNMENSGFYQEFSEWIEEQDNLGNLPKLTDDKKAAGLEVLTSGYIFDASESNARYQIQIRLTYYENK